MVVQRVTIRRGSMEDAEDIARIYNEAIDDLNATFDDYHVLADRYRPYFVERPGFGLVCAIESGAVAGWAAVEPISDRNAYRFTCRGALYVARAHRRKGVGHVLSVAMLDLGRSLGYHSVVGEVLKTNPAALAMDIKVGYRVVGEIDQAGFRNGRWIGLVVLQRMLTDS